MCTFEVQDDCGLGTKAACWLSLQQLFFGLTQSDSTAAAGVHKKEHQPLDYTDSIINYIVGLRGS